jgi:hypothetical protein
VADKLRPLEDDPPVAVTSPTAARTSYAPGSVTTGSEAAMRRPPAVRLSSNSVVPSGPVTVIAAVCRFGLSFSKPTAPVSGIRLPVSRPQPAVAERAAATPANTVRLLEVHFTPQSVQPGA